MENEKILIITVGLVISVLGGVYLYTQNTGINACLNQGANNHGYDSWKDLIEIQNNRKKLERSVDANIRANMVYGKCADSKY